MPSRPRLLFLSQCLPYPPNSGVTNRTYNVVKQLSKEFEVWLFPFFRKNHQRDRANREHSQNHLRLLLHQVAEAAPIPAEHSRIRRLSDHVRSVVRRRPYTYYEYRSERYTKQIKDTLKHVTPDLVHLDSLDLHGLLPNLPGVPIACTHHSIESELLRLRAYQIPGPALRKYILHQAALVEKVERRLTPRIDLNVMMSDLDASRLRELAPKAPTTVAPNGVDTRRFRPAAASTVEAGKVVFLGPTYMFPNRDAISYMLNTIWPIVTARQASASLELIGKISVAERRRLEHLNSVVSLGFVEDIRPHIAQAACCVAPLRVGGGTRLKILDYWALGKAVVSTSVGCEGLHATDGENILIRDDPKEFACAVLEILSNDGLRTKLEVNARKTAEGLYSWDTIGAQLRLDYSTLF